MELDISNPSDLAPNEGCPGQAKIDICDSGPKSSQIFFIDLWSHGVMTLRIISYNVDGFQAIWLTLKQDPRAGKARATLDREVKCHFYRTQVRS